MLLCMFIVFLAFLSAVSFYGAGHFDGIGTTFICGLLFIIFGGAALYYLLETIRTLIPVVSTAVVG